MWISPDCQTLNQIDYIIIQNNWKNRINNSRAYHSADVGSDHFLLLAYFQFDTPKPKKIPRAPKKYNVDKLHNQETTSQFRLEIENAFSPLLGLDTNNIEDLYSQFKNAPNNVTEKVVGFRKSKMVKGLPHSVEQLCDERRKSRQLLLNDTQSDALKMQYKDLNKRVKSEIKAHKRKNLDCKVEELEASFRENDSFNLFKAVKDLENKPRKSLSAVKDKQGKTHTNKTKILKCWEEHFKAHLNTAFPYEPGAINDIPEPPEDADSLPDIEKSEILKAVKKLKNRKAARIDSITAEVIKNAGQPMIDMLHKIFNTVWKHKQTPKDWAKMLVTPIHKKGDKLNPGNYRAISLLSIPGKVFSRILLNRIHDRAENAISESQFGFRPGRGTVDAIFIVKQLIEKAREHNIKLHFNFVDFKAAFDTIWRKALWKMLLSIGVDQNIVSIIEKLYDDTECAVVIDGQITEWFSVEVGLRQGCLLSPVLFNLFLEQVMKEIKEIENKLSFSDNISLDIRYADDTTLLAAVFEKLKLSTAQLEQACKKWGMKINGAKCKILSPLQDKIDIDGDEVEHVEEFVFLGSVVPDSTSDVNRRIALASTAFGRLNPTIWSKKTITKAIKVRLYRALILPIATYASETWTLKSRDINKLESFEMRCLRSILGITRRDRIRNTEIRKKLNIKQTITQFIREKRLRWFGHVARRPKLNYVSASFTGNFTNKRPKGRPPKRWIDQIRDDTGLPIATAVKYAADRSKWRKTCHKKAKGSTSCAV